MLKKWLKYAGFALVIVCAGLASRYVISNHILAKDQNNASTQALFAASFNNQDEIPQALNQWQGKIIVLNFWATWCPPCREEMPELSALNTQYQDKNLIVLGLAIDDLAAIKEFGLETKVSYPLLVAEEGGMELAANLGNNKGVLPFTLIIKPDGSIAKTFYGRISKPLLEETLKSLL